MILHADFETRSTVDLKRSGVDVYSKHPTTDALCMAFSICERDSVTPQIHLWKLGEPHSPELLHLFGLVEAGSEFVAHNAPFELAIWNNVCAHKYGWPKLSPSQATCTMAAAYAMGLPGSLEKAAAAVGITEQKDMAGSRVMMQLAKPKSYATDGAPIWHDDPAKYEKLYSYCVQDLKVEHALFQRLMPLPPSEREIWLLDYQINQRGIQVDLEAVKTAVALVEFEKKRLDEQMRIVTANSVATCSATGQLTDWIGWQGVVTEGVAKADVLELLAKEDLPAKVRKALLLRQEAAKSSTAKLGSMLEGASPDGRMRGLFQYHGAATGRWAGRRAQMQNYPRPRLSQEDIEEVFKMLGER